MRKDIEIKIKKFLDNYAHILDVVGVLACGSYITGHPNKHSDLDLQLVLDSKCDYKEQGTRVVDGVIIDYHANTRRQNLAYFERDYNSICPIGQIMYSTGEIYFDKTGEVKWLKEEARKQLAMNYTDIVTEPNQLEIYSIWNDLDDLQAVLEEGRADFDFLYYNKLNNLLFCLYKKMKITFSLKTAYGQLVSDIIRKKYLLEEIENKELRTLISVSIAESNKIKRFEAYTRICNYILNEYNFKIDGFTFKSKEGI